VTPAAVSARGYKDERMMWPSDATNA